VVCTWDDVHARTNAHTYTVYMTAN